MVQWATIMTAAAMLFSTVPADTSNGVEYAQQQVLQQSNISWMPENISVDGRTPNGDFFIRGDGWLCGLATADGTILCQPQYDDMGILSQEKDCDLLWVRKGEYYGLMNAEGKLITPIAFEEIGIYAEGFLPAKKNGKYGYLDHTGKEAIDFVFGRCNSFENGYAEVFQYNAQGILEQGIINTHGELVIPCEYTQVMPCADGLFAAHKGEYWGYLNTLGQTVIPFTLSYAGQFQESAVFAGRYGKYGYFDSTGTQFVPFKYENAHSFLNGLAGVSNNGKWGFIDSTGKEVIPCQYDDCDYLRNNGLILVKKDNRWGAIDATGAVKIPLIYTEMQGFENGYACVAQNDLSATASWGIIDEAGKVCVPLEHQAISLPDENNLVVVFNNGKYGCRSLDGSMIIPCSYDDVYSLFSGMVRVRLDGKYGLFDANGKQIVPIKYQYLTSSNQAKDIVAQLDGKHGILQADGTDLVPCSYEWIDLYDTCAVVRAAGGRCGILSRIK